MSEDDIIERAMDILESRLQMPEKFLTSTKDTASYLRLRFADYEHEAFQVLFLNSQHGLIKTEELFRGTLNASAVYPREVVKAALHFNAAAVILSHNHPSGKTEPSQADIEITKQLVDALKLIEVRVLDHMIVGEGKPYSFAEHGMMPV